MTSKDPTVKGNTLDAFLERTHYYPSYKDVRPPARFTPKEGPFFLFQKHVRFKSMFVLDCIGCYCFFSVLSKKAFAFMFEFRHA